MSEFEEFEQNLASLGEDEVRRKLSQGVWANRRKTWAQNWLANVEASRATSHAEQDLALSREANEIARSALEISRSAKVISVVAIVVSTLTAIAVAIIQLVAQKPS